MHPNKRLSAAKFSPLIDPDRAFLQVHRLSRIRPLREVVARSATRCASIFAVLVIATPRKPARFRAYSFSRRFRLPADAARRESWAFICEPTWSPLSACHGAWCEDIQVRDMRGSCRWAFLRAGASSELAISGLWGCDRHALPRKSHGSDFYAQMAGAAPRGHAAHNKLKLVHSSGAYRKPYYWAPVSTLRRKAVGRAPWQTTHWSSGQAKKPDRGVRKRGHDPPTTRKFHCNFIAGYPRSQGQHVGRHCGYVHGGASSRTPSHR